MAAGTSAGAANWMRACSVARFTLASSTPGSFLSVRSTRPTQEAQVMPCTGRSTETEGVDVAVDMPPLYALHNNPGRTGATRRVLRLRVSWGALAVVPVSVRPGVARPCAMQVENGCRRLPVLRG